MPDAREKTERLASYLLVGKHNCDQAAVQVVDNDEHLRKFRRRCNSLKTGMSRLSRRCDKFTIQQEQMLPLLMI